MVIDWYFMVIHMSSAINFNKSQLLGWISARGKDQENLFAMARQARQESFGNRAHIRASLEISNYCGKNCRYCAMAAYNHRLERYRMSADEILAIAGKVSTAGIRILMLQSGRDYKMDQVLLNVLPRIAGELGMEIILCLGERNRDKYRQLIQAGAKGYIIKFESSDTKFYEDISQSSAQERLECIRAVKELGFKLGVGNIAGLPGQSLESIAGDILLAGKLRPDYVSVSPFIPNENTPFSFEPAGDLEITLNIMALLRLSLPESLIPAVSALEKLEPNGQLRGLRAGANVATVNFTPDQYRSKYQIYSPHRYIVSLQHARRILEDAGLNPS